MRVASSADMTVHEMAGCLADDSAGDLAATMESGSVQSLAGVMAASKVDL